jgi:RNA polymerase sigma factor (sigma-70 family)
VAAREARLVLGRVRAALHQALVAVSPEDRRILWMRYCEGQTVASIARRLALAQQSTYRRVRRLRRKLRSDLDAGGFDWPSVRACLRALAESGSL